MRFSSAVRILTCSPVLASCMAFRDCRAVLKAARVAEKSASIFYSVRLLCGNAIVAERQSGQTAKERPVGDDGRNVAVLTTLKDFE